MWGVSYTFALCRLWSVTPAEKFSFKVQFPFFPFPLGEQEIPAGPCQHQAGCYNEFFHYAAVVKTSPLLAPGRGKQTSGTLLHPCQPDSRFALISSSPQPSKQGSNLLLQYLHPISFWKAGLGTLALTAHNAMWLKYWVTKKSSFSFLYQSKTHLQKTIYKTQWNRKSVSPQDFRAFSADHNVTIKSLTEAAVLASTARVHGVC